MTLNQQVRAITNKAWTIESKWSKYYDERPWCVLHPDYDTIMGEDLEPEVLLPLPTPEHMTSQSLEDLIAIMNGVK